MTISKLPLPITTLLAVLLSTLLFSCQPTFKAAYYSLEDFQPYQVYRYECLDKPIQTQYWKMSDRSNGLMLTEAYDSRFEQFEHFVEEFAKDGTYLVEFWDADLNGEFSAWTAIDTEVFLWRSKGPYQWSAKQTFGENTVHLTKSRQFLGKSLIQIQGTPYDCLRFRDDFTYDYGDYQVTYYQYSYYTKGLGLVKYERHLPDNEVVVLELTDILSPPEWEALRKGGQP